MTNHRTISPELAAVVDRARVAAQDAGELRPTAGGALDEGLSPEARTALADWLASGDYDRAVAEIVGDDADLASQ